jgi:hypothetical protein
MIPEVPSPILTQASQPEAALPPDAVPPPPLPSAEEMRAADAVFAEHKDSSIVAGMFGLWSGALLLHDLATEHFAAPADEDEQEEEKKPKKE